MDLEEGSDFFTHCAGGLTFIGVTDLVLRVIDMWYNCLEKTKKKIVI